MTVDSGAGRRALLGEIYFATVRAIGTPLKGTVVEPLESALNGVNFHYSEQKLSERFADLNPLDDVLSKTIPRGEADPAQRYQFLMDAGDYLRELTGSSDALLIESIRHLREQGRDRAHTEANQNARRGVAFHFRNLMHPAEAEKLRRLYRRQLFVISVFSSEDERRKHLSKVLAGDDGQQEREQDHIVSLLMSREQGHVRTTSDYDRQLVAKRQYRLNIGRTFEHGDLFVDIQAPDQTRSQIARFVELIFGHPFHTPTPDEIGMADAFSAALQSGNLARQVGAAICTEDGDLVTTGTNDVPRPMGGVYRSTDVPDNRDWNRSAGWGRDPSDSTRRHILTDLLKRMIADPVWLVSLDKHIGAQSDEAPGASKGAGETLSDLLRTEDARLRFQERNCLDELTDALIASPVIRDSQFFDVIEYGRTLHAEMDAITSAARKGIPVKGSTLYCTTFPCHECARLIISSGIRRVIYIEPYLKSRVAELYESEVRFTSLAHSRTKPVLDKVDFVPYVGISPRRFQELFSWVPRKSEDLLSSSQRRLHGQAIDWESNRMKSEVRDSIISASSMRSTSRLQDLYDHEGELVDDYRKTYVSLVKIVDDGTPTL